MDKVEQIQFSLQGIKTEQFATFQENYTPKKEIGIAVELELKLNQSIKQVGVVLTLHYDQSKKKIILLVLSCHFRIEDESWKNLVNIDNTLLTLPRDFVTHLSTLTVGTARGVLFAKTEGSFCSQFLVPLINVDSIVSQDAIFELKSA